jgi:hypothetical protein
VLIDLKDLNIINRPELSKSLDKDIYVRQKILNMHVKAGYDYPENGPDLSASASGDYKDAWVQIWFVGMDWNGYWYMVDSKHDEPYLIAKIDNFGKDTILESLSPEVPKNTKYTQTLWQKICDAWVLKRAKRLDKSLQKSWSVQYYANRYDEEYPQQYNPRNRNAYNLDFTAFDESIEDIFYIPINRLKTDYQTSEALNFDKIQENVEKMKNGENLEPIVIGYDYDVHDGHHRIEASKIMKYTHVPCIVAGNDDIEVLRAKEQYAEVWKSFNEAEHPRDDLGRFTTVYHLTSDKDFKYDEGYANTKQEMGSGLYTTSIDDAMYWHRALQDKEGNRPPYAVPIDASEAKLIHRRDIPDDRLMAKHLISHYGSSKEALKAVDAEEDAISGETFENSKTAIAMSRLYAKTKGYDGMVLHDEKEGDQVIFFSANKLKFKSVITEDELFSIKRKKDLGLEKGLEKSILYEYSDPSQFPFEASGCIFRGIGQKEFDFIKRTGYIQTKGKGNDEDQENTATCFSELFSQAEGYARTNYDLYNEPHAYVIAVKRPANAEENELGEIEVKGKTPIGSIMAVFPILQKGVNGEMIYNVKDLDIINLQKSVKTKDLPPGGDWRTIKGSHVYIKDDKILAGAEGKVGKTVKTEKKPAKAAKNTSEGVQNKEKPLYSNNKRGESPQNKKGADDMKAAAASKDAKGLQKVNSKSTMKTENSKKGAGVNDSGKAGTGNVRGNTKKTGKDETGDNRRLGKVRDGQKESGSSGSELHVAPKTQKVGSTEYVEYNRYLTFRVE